VAEVNYQQAVRELQDRIGMRWDGTESGGRAEMVRVLTSELGCDHRRANETLDAMIKGGTLRYHRVRGDLSDAAAGVPVEAGPGSTGPAGTPTIAGFAGTSAADPLAGIGYWQIGQDLSGDAGRKGQVTPT